MRFPNAETKDRCFEARWGDPRPDPTAWMRSGLNQVPHSLYIMIIMQGSAERKRTFDQTPWAMHTASLHPRPQCSGR